MSEEYGNNFVVLTDENGKEIELEHLDTVEYNGQTYMAFIPAEMSVEDAYRAVHRKEIEAATAQVTAQMTAQQLSNAIQSGSYRPQENGTSGRSSSVITFDYAKASREERAKHDAWVRSELAKGRNPRPEDYPG